MTCLFTLLGLLVLGIFVGPWVLLGLQHRRQREQRARVDDLQTELARLRARVDQVLAASGTAPASAPPTSTTAATSAPALATAASPVEVAPQRPVEADLAPQIEGTLAPPTAAPAAPAMDAATIAGAAAVGLPGSPLTEPPLPPPSAPPPPPPIGGDAATPPSGEGRGPTIDWERWIGVRGAAVLGGIVLALAGILFVRYSIEHGLISPTLRVAMGILFGLGAIAWSLRLRSRAYGITADAIAGAGIVLLYAALWAAHALYGFIGAGPAYALMSLVTVTCGVLSWRNASMLIAVLGLAGGFATPFLIAAKTDNPIGLFGYVLLLDLGLIALARRRGWSALALLALLGTMFYQAFWVLTRMRAESVLFGLAILGLFALVFAFAGWARGRTAEEQPHRGWLVAEGVGLLAPFGFALYFAARADLGPRLYPVAALLLILSLAAQWIARRNAGADVLASGAAAGSIAVVLVWSWEVEWTRSLVWELVAVCVALAAAFHLFFELDVRAPGVVHTTPSAPVAIGGEDAARRPSSLSILVAEAGFLGLLILDSYSSLESPWPWVAGFVLIAALLMRLSIDPARAFAPLIAAGGVAAGMSGWYLIAAAADRLPAPEIYFGVVLLLGAVFQALAMARASGPARRASDLAAGVYPAVVLAGLLLGAQKPALEAPVFLAVSMLLGLLLVLATTRLASGVGYLAGMILLAVVNTAWCVSNVDLPRQGAHSLLWLVVDAIAAAAFALWPSFAPRLGASRTAWRAAALAGPVWFFAMGKMWGERFGDRAIGLLPLLLAAITLGAAYRGRRIWASDEATARTGHLAWFGAVVLGFVAVAVPLQLEKEWITVGWALEGLAVTALWKRLDHPGLKYFGAALLAAVTARLLVNPEVLRYHERAGLPVLNWLAYAYLVPAACLIGVRGILARAASDETDRTSLSLEVASARPWESALYSRRHPVLASAAAVAAIFVVFAWINLTIFHAFSTGSALTLSVERLPARDLTLSLAWVVYAVTLLGLGMARDSSALRWLSLGFLVLSIGKVFLYDLGELRDLYRVASLVGLAISLILVSLAYQRFVFRRRASDDPT
jgi:uncharacterized membrane protein